MYTYIYFHIHTINSKYFQAIYLCIYYIYTYIHKCYILPRNYVCHRTTSSVQNFKSKNTDINKIFSSAFGTGLHPCEKLKWVLANKNVYMLPHQRKTTQNPSSTSLSRATVAVEETKVQKIKILEMFSPELLYNWLHTNIPGNQLMFVPWHLL